MAKKTVVLRLSPSQADSVLWSLYLADMDARRSSNLAGQPFPLSPDRFVSLRDKLLRAMLRCQMASEKAGVYFV